MESTPSPPVRGTRGRCFPGEACGVLACPRPGAEGQRLAAVPLPGRCPAGSSCPAAPLCPACLQAVPALAVRAACSRGAGGAVACPGAGCASAPAAASVSGAASARRTVPLCAWCLAPLAVPSSSLRVSLVVALIRFMPYLPWEQTGGRQEFRPSARLLLKRGLLGCWYARYEVAQNFACDGWGCPCMVVCETLVGRVGCRCRGCGDAE